MTSSACSREFAAVTVHLPERERERERERDVNAYAHTHTHIIYRERRISVRYVRSLRAHLLGKC